MLGLGASLNVCRGSLEGQGSERHQAGRISGSRTGGLLTQAEGSMADRLGNLLEVGWLGSRVVGMGLRN